MIRQHNHPKRIIIRVLVSGQLIDLRHKPDEWKADPLAGFKQRLQDTSLVLFTRSNGRDVWIRPRDISAYWSWTDPVA